MVHSPTINELQNPNLIEDNTILTELSKSYDNRFIFLSDLLSNHFAGDDELIFKDTVHYEENGHLLVSNYLAPIVDKVIQGLKNNH